MSTPFQTQWWPDGGPPRGATYDGSGVTFALWAPMAERVEVCLFDDHATERRVPLTDLLFGVWSGRVPGLHPGQRYGYRVHGTWDPYTGHRFNGAKLLADPYARAITGEADDHAAVFGHVAGGDDTVRDDRDSAPYVPRSVVVDPTFDWGEDPRPYVPWSDTVLYELHVRGATMRHPDVPPELRGTYAGLAHPSVLGYLRDLGVTTVELLPVHHFVSEFVLRGRGLSNYWGYNTLGFFAPHAGYASGGTEGQQVAEFKQMVKAMHEAGLEVVLDVVYNHTAEQNEFGPTYSFRGIHNIAYYRLDGGGRRYRDLSGTGNTLNLRHPDIVRLVLDSLRYWVQDMHVDGFRFDLAPILTRGVGDVDMAGAFLAAVGQDPVLSRVKLIAEPWDLGFDGYQVGGFPAPWSEWNDRFRDAVREFWAGSADGVRDLASRLSGSSDLYRRSGRRPFASINYVTSHDGYTLRDLVSYVDKHNEANGEANDDGHNDNRSVNFGVEGETDDPEVVNLRLRQVRGLLTTLLLATGVPMLMAGDESGRTQHGNNNAYCQDNEISWLDWADEQTWPQLRDTVRALLRIRREHQVFRRPHFFHGRLDPAGGRRDVGWFAPWGEEMDDEAWHDSSLRTLGMFLAGEHTARTAPSGEPVRDDSFLLWLHGGDAPVDVTLPGPPWAMAYSVVLDTSDSLGTDQVTAGEHLRLAPHTAVVLRAV
ncbi:glycogen operon protein [Actinopolymorpha cephalotaxi]|uniref:Glycogen operon protein n=1 Tax=Actinopolymorpha cephalotaxi TaxID=504797 RepID=A0A1I3AG40_9ACTN|nr:glycogen debranching protein GlgX [Actinopolymorpha cephalotaxi]NYH82105.1 glycogen operon protein [Actinopolymorpha cephalotaxi]SFH48669.1 glycogen operon protein [Actinopolymorpha cephalotaxi]